MHTNLVLDHHSDSAAIRTLEKTLIRVGSLVGAAVLLIRATLDSPAALVGGMALFAVALVGIIRAGRSSASAPKPAKDRYAVGVAASVGTYAATIALVADHQVSWDVTVPLALAVMTPAFLLAHSISTLDR